MKNVMNLPLAAFILTSGVTVMAADFDGSKSLICAPVEAIDCIAGGGCEKGIPDDFGAPAFMRIDFAKKLIIGPKLSTPINAMQRDLQQILMQGTELGMAWSMALNTENGKMVTTFGSRDGAYVLFGSCTPQ
jgi:hypothetical protein